jgi:aminoglycoside 2'-N-acetyltransferase I
MYVVSFPEAEVPRDLRVQALALQAQAWPDDETSEGPDEPGLSHDPALRPVSMLLVDDGSVLAALDILSKEITHRGGRYSASGLSTVVTDRAHRGKGHGRRLILAARDAIRASEADLSLFTCDRPLQGFYERAGWRALAGAVLVGGTPDAPFPSDQFDKVVLAMFFSPEARKHAEAFTRSRIELYPGNKDKLW